jgi:hypothetical protein
VLLIRASKAAAKAFDLTDFDIHFTSTRNIFRFPKNRNSRDGRAASWQSHPAQSHTG